MHSVSIGRLSKMSTQRLLSKKSQMSLHHLTTLNTQLQQDMRNTLFISKEIKNEVMLGKQAEKEVQKSINLLNAKAEQLVKRYEQEKEKHEALQTLVSHLQKQLYEVKVQKYEDLKNKIETDQLQQMTNHLQFREKQLQKLNEKTNHSIYQIDKKTDTIRALRSERTIFSILFDKIQRELCNLQHCYKVLVIERNIEDYIYQKKIREFNQFEHNALRQLQRIENKVIRQKEEFSVKAKINTQVGSFIRNSLNEISILKPNKQTQKGELKQKQNNNQQQLNKLKIEKKVKQIFNDFGINNLKDFPNDIESLNRYNQSLLKQTAQLDDQIFQTQKQKINLKTKQRPQRKKETAKKQKQLKKAIAEANQKILDHQVQINEFKACCQTVVDGIEEYQGLNGNEDLWMSEKGDVAYLLGYLEKIFENWYENREVKIKQHVKGDTKRLTSLLGGQYEGNQLAICQEEQLIQFAKKNLLIQ